MMTLNGKLIKRFHSEKSASNFASKDKKGREQKPF